MVITAVKWLLLVCALISLLTYLVLGSWQVLIPTVVFGGGWLYVAYEDVRRPKR
jgi:hypothetical protein